MSWIDLTHPLSERTPTWEDAEPVRFETVCEIGQDCPVHVTRITLGTHNGTHLDAPSHYLADGHHVADLSLDAMVGPAWICQTDAASVLDASLLESLDIPAGTRRILFKTSNTARNLMGNPIFVRDYVGLDPSGAHWLANRGIELVGLDYLSVQAFSAHDDTHRILLKRNTILLEGLILHSVTTGWWDLICLPLLGRDLDGAPARVIARPLP